MAELQDGEWSALPGRPERSKLDPRGGVEASLAYRNCGLWLTCLPLTRGYPGPMNDPIYKRIFSFPRMVEDLLRGFAKGDWIKRADFSALQKAPAEYVGDDLRKRLGDSLAPPRT